MAKDEDPLDLSLEDLLMEEELDRGELAPAVAGKLSASALFGRHSTRSNKAAMPESDEGTKLSRESASGSAPLFLKQHSRKAQPHLSADIDRDILASRIEEEMLEEFNRVIPKLMDEALDHMVERLPVIINQKLTTHMLDYLLENRERILKESSKKDDT
jgi:hypothetical protein